MTNAEMDSANPFSLVLLGQPALRSRLRLGSFAALDQRVTLRYTLPAMSPAETAGYVAHHITLAGRKDTLFSDDAVARIHDSGRGLPRAINNLARQALVAACANHSSLVDDKAARQAVAEAEVDWTDNVGTRTTTLIAVGDNVTARCRQQQCRHHHQVVGRPTAALIGAEAATEGSGAAYLFSDDGVAWVERVALTDPNGTSGDYFGWSVALSPTGGLVGAPSPFADSAGLTYAYER